MAQSDETLGRSIVRDVVTEELHHIVNGFTAATGQTFAPNMWVSITSTGTVTPLTGVTVQPLGYVVSTYDTNDTGRVRIAVPFSKTEFAYADGAIDEGNLLACSGFDATSGKPKYKLATAGDWVVAICLTAAADTTITGKIGVLRVPFLLFDSDVASFDQAAAVAALTDNSGGAAADGTIAVITAPTAITDNSGGEAADGTIAVVTAPTALTDSTTGTPSGTDTLEAISQAEPANLAAQAVINGVIADNIATVAAQLEVGRLATVALTNAIPEVTARQTENRAAIVALTDAIRELATKQNAVISALKTANLMDT